MVTLGAGKSRRGVLRSVSAEPSQLRKWVQQILLDLSLLVPIVFRSGGVYLLANSSGSVSILITRLSGVVSGIFFGGPAASGSVVGSEIAVDSGNG